MEKLQHIVTRVLIMFALISIGFALGKNSKVHSPSTTKVANGTYIQVYYMHSTFRCVTCNTIESMTKKLLDTEYSTALEESKIRWKEIDFQENEELAKKFEVVASCVVVANIDDGAIVDFKRLDDVWTKMKNKQEFDAYVSAAIDSYQQPGDVQ